MEDFCDGTRLAILLTMMDVLKVEELQKHIFGNPSNQRQYIHNCQTIIKALHVRVPEMPLLLRSPVEWLRPPVPCPETLLAQLYEIWKHVVIQRKDRFENFFSDSVTFRDGVRVKLT